MKPDKNRKKIFEEHLFQDEKDSFVYFVRKSRRRSFQIVVYPEKRVEVHAPLSSNYNAINDLLLKKKGWVIKKMEQAPGKSIPRRPGFWKDGESIFFLGTPYQISVAQAKKNKVELRGSCMEISVKDKDDNDVALKTVKKFLMESSILLFKERIIWGLERMARYNLVMPQIKVRKMRTRWGSCSSKKSITLNSELIHYPVELIDYIVLHELCHMVVPNHSSRYYRLLESVLPDWKERRGKLNAMFKEIV